MNGEEVKVAFSLKQDEDQWPPFTVESLWCGDIGENKYIVNNVPFYIQGVSYGDVITVKKLARKFGSTTLLAFQGIH